MGNLLLFHDLRRGVHALLSYYLPLSALLTGLAVLWAPSASGEELALAAGTPLLLMVVVARLLIVLKLPPQQTEAQKARVQAVLPEIAAWLVPLVLGAISVLVAVCVALSVPVYLVLGPAWGGGFAVVLVPGFLVAGAIGFLLAAWRLSPAIVWTLLPLVLSRVLPGAWSFLAKLGATKTPEPAAVGTRP